MKPRILSLLILVLAAASTGAAETALYQDWLQQMREQPRGPFARVRWFCLDGTVLPPVAYACSTHGGGYQHGEWSEQTLELRARGYLLGTLMAGMQPAQVLAGTDFENTYGQLLIERFLMGVDDGWIYRRARFYRGAMQEEDERAGARRLLLELLSRDEWLDAHYVAMRTGVKLLPHGEDSSSVGRVRQWAAALSEEDPQFMPLRVKIHGTPGASDAAAVRAYGQGADDPGLRARYAALAQEIDQVYRGVPLADHLNRLAGATWMPSALAAVARKCASDWERATPLARLSISGHLLAALRDSLPEVRAPSARLELMDFSLRLETEHFRVATIVREQLEAMSRQQIIRSLAAAGDAAYGTGLLNPRLQRSLQEEIASLLAGGVNVARYQQILSYLNRMPGWGLQALRRYFYLPMQKLGEIEPMAMFFIQDQLRGSPLLFYSESLNLLARDAGKMAGVRHRFFGEEIGAGFSALNPGLARGRLWARPGRAPAEPLREDGIYVLPETIPELPPVAGILTAGEGNPLSHVQLLARNLGIPNVSVNPPLQRALLEHDGDAIVLAVSPGGLVEICADGPAWDHAFKERDSAGAARIVPDLDKLDLSRRQVLAIDRLSAKDSGRSVGPKAAKLGELRKHYPEAVARGVAIPFGVFKAEALDQPHPAGGTVYDWMLSEYARLEAMPSGGIGQEQQTERFRAELYQRILDTRPSDDFKADLRRALADAFDGQEVGLFVRSDTNVEDLAGFTGAGLNLTLPNVIGFERLLESIPRVWASPFTSRAFAWRQSHMTQPEHVYSSVLLLESVGSDKSGVLVTADIDTGASDTLSVAVNEGLGGAVDGQAAESLRIPLKGGPVRVLATATAPRRRVLYDQGGIAELPTSGGDQVLTTAEIAQLQDFARSLPQRFPAVADDAGKPVAVDVEFGFLDGRLRLFQLRPFLDSAAVARSSYLKQMDARGGGNLDRLVDMSRVPGR